MSPLAAIVRKEWAETLKNKTIVWTFLGLGIVFTLLPIGLGLIAPRVAADTLLADPDVSRVTDVLAAALPGFGTLSPVGQFQVYILRQFLPMFLLLPVMGAMSIATYSIIGEKTSRSLEALLATPTTTRDLLLGKALASTVPAVLATWALFAVYVGVTLALGGPAVARYAFDPPALLLMILMTPLVAFMALALGVIVSSRSTDPRSAQQIASILVLPVVALVVGQSSGLFLLGLPFVLVGALVVVVLDVVLMRVGVRLFQREAILTRWR